MTCSFSSFQIPSLFIILLNKIKLIKFLKVRKQSPLKNVSQRFFSFLIFINFFQKHFFLLFSLTENLFFFASGFFKNYFSSYEPLCKKAGVIMTFKPTISVHVTFLLFFFSFFSFFYFSHHNLILVLCPLLLFFCVCVYLVFSLFFQVQADVLLLLLLLLFFYLFRETLFSLRKHLVKLFVIFNTFSLLFKKKTKNHTKTI